EAFSVDVCGLFELERTLKCDRKGSVATEEHEVVELLEGERDGLALFITGQRLLDSFRQHHHLMKMLTSLGSGEAPSHTSQMYCKNEQREKLRGEALGGGHRDLFAGMGVNVAVGFAGDGRALH